jgi:hypothetical protein
MTMNYSGNLVTDSGNLVTFYLKIKHITLYKGSIKSIWDIFRKSRETASRSFLVSGRWLPEFFNKKLGEIGRVTETTRISDLRYIQVLV